MTLRSITSESMQREMLSSRKTPKAFIRDVHIMAISLSCMKRHQSFSNPDFDQ